MTKSNSSTSGGAMTISFTDDKGFDVTMNVERGKKRQSPDGYDINDPSGGSSNKFSMDGLPKWMQMLLAYFMNGGNGGDTDTSWDNNGKTPTNNGKGNTLTGNGTDKAGQVDKYYKNMSDKDASRAVWDMIPDGENWTKQQLAEKMDDPDTTPYQKAAIKKFLESKDGGESLFAQADNQGNYWYRGTLRGGSDDGTIGRDDIEHKWHVGKYTSIGDY
jgi:hypothetical protein